MRNEADAEYYKLPVIYWKDIFGSKQWPFKRRPRQMHSTLSLRGVCVWVERFFGIPRDAMRFVRSDGQLIAPEDHYLVNVKQLQEAAQRDQKQITIQWQSVVQLAEDSSHGVWGHGVGVHAGSTSDPFGPLAAFVEGFEWLHGGNEAVVLFDPQFVPADNEQFAAFKAAIEAHIRGGNLHLVSEIMPGYWCDARC